MQNKKTAQELRKELQEPAERTVKVSLALRQFAKDQGIEASEEDVNKRVQEVVQHYQGPDHDGHQHGELDPEDVKEHVQANIRNEAALEKLQSLATVKDA